MIARRFRLTVIAGLLAGSALADDPRTVARDQQPAGVPSAAAMPTAPQVIAPEALRWYEPFGNDSLQAAWVLGTEAGPGAYLLRVRLKQGTRIPAHRHPDGRSTTVLKGQLYVGFGEQPDDSQLVLVPEGGVYVAPAGVAHFLWARDGEVVYQEAGVGPTATLLVARPGSY